MSDVRRGGESRGNTEARIDFLVESAPEWSLELGLPALSQAAADHALKILSFISQARRDAELRIFPSEQAGLTIQKRGATETRILEVNPGEITGAIHDKKLHVHHHYLLESDRAAAAFLMAA
ncbi:hypothetical protein CSX12_13860 [Microbacterium sp. Y-01]|uniref:hypothetical protein n=1 Tax=Microbacterium sp. Y-01 TaxID=2048898 RepID=UPI000F5F64BB|nr:hypothetical protein [Microbacterium sp. Y-01]AZH79445.1 hypothetical protein CSX12_13860 [Microbacterium sp. Y-01]